MIVCQRLVSAPGLHASASRSHFAASARTSSSPSVSPCAFRTRSTEDENLREVNVGSLDGRSDGRSWDTYDSVLDAWRHGDYAARFPGGEDCAGLAARLRAAFTAMTGPGDDQVLVVAHGANIRAALPLLAAVPDPGQDLPTGGTARFVTSPGDAGIRLRLLSWAS